jgi:thymidylate synthase (FAD)
MNKFKKPKVFLVGQTFIDRQGIEEYLEYTNQEEFLEEVIKASLDGLSGMEILCSFYAKLCYSALTTKKNENISKTRSIGDNIRGTIKSGHGSVFEHASFNFVVTDCSRVFTHELVRHRVGTAFSQTSGRYVRGEEINFVHDPILNNVVVETERCIHDIEHWYNVMVKSTIKDSMDFALKKKITSALRRILPNGQTNEIGFSCNLRALRHLITMRTSRHAEWEIRYVFNQIVELTKGKLGVFYDDMKLEMIDGLNEVTFEHGAI